MIKKLAIAVVSFVLLIAGLVGYAFWQHRAESDRQRVASAEHVKHIPAGPLSAADACWLAQEFYTSRRGLAGRHPVVTCDGVLSEVPGGYKLTRVLTASEPLKGRMGHSLCIARGASWTVVGEAYQLGDCLHLPAPGAADPFAAARAEVGKELLRKATAAREAILAALAAPPPPETCGPLPSLDTAHTPLVDERKLDFAFEDEPGLAHLVPEDGTISLCAEGAKPHPLLTPAVCRGDRSFTHALVTRVQRLEAPKVDPGERTFSGGILGGELWLVDLATSRALCRRPFLARMPNVISEGSQTSAFSNAVKTTLASTANTLTGFDLVR